jgi:sugar phosphate isomerase/epimerase
MNIKDRIYVSTVASDCCLLAEKYGLGIEIAEFCTAYNMDTYFEQTDRQVRHKMKSGVNFTFHAPFNELSPAAIDPLVLEITKKRDLQAIELAENYGINKIIIHSGFVPRVYYSGWFLERATQFWQELMPRIPNELDICIENVMEDEPDMLVQLSENIDRPNFGLCLDLGHAWVSQSKPINQQWAEKMMKHLHHLHIHNNFGLEDQHLPIGEGVIPVDAIMRSVLEQNSTATFTIENPVAESSVLWLLENGYLG